jgi:hypothetical protein
MALQNAEWSRLLVREQGRRRDSPGRFRHGNRPTQKTRAPGDFVPG